MNDALKRHFEAAREFAEERAPRWVEWCRTRPPVEQVGHVDFIAEYAFVVSVSGFRASVVEERFPRLAKALHGFDPEQIVRMPYQQIRDLYERHMLRNGAKAEAFARGIRALADFETIQKLKAMLAKGHVDCLKSLPWIGDVTKYHLARNLGVDVAKPDVHLTRLAKKFGYDDVGRMCADLAAEFDERVAAVDGILWEYARSGP